jgi:hypothetical protein
MMRFVVCIHHQIFSERPNQEEREGSPVVRMGKMRGGETD